MKYEGQTSEEKDARVASQMYDMYVTGMHTTSLFPVRRPEEIRVLANNGK